MATKIPKGPYLERSVETKKIVEKEKHIRKLTVQTDSFPDAKFIHGQFRATLPNNTATPLKTS